MYRTRNAAYLQGYRGFESHPVRQLKRPQLGAFLIGGMAEERTRRFDKIGDSRFWALGGHRVPAERSEQSEDDEYAFAHIRSNPTQQHLSGAPG
jgi:hypothetical protein